jgi:serine/threonine protein kinase
MLALSFSFLSLSLWSWHAILGRGGYGEVRLVRQKSNGDVYALKSMEKRAMVMKNQVAHVVSERDFLAQAENPWITNMFASFQDESMLYMVLEFLPGLKPLRPSPILQSLLSRFSLASFFVSCFARERS